jgi:arylsulfatase B
LASFERHQLTRIHKGGNNYPLRSGKYADYEGGVRVNAFAAGGLIPAPRRGTVSERLISISDVYATLIRLAKYGPNTKPNRVALAAIMHDQKAAKAGLAQPDAVDTIWGAITDEDDEPKRDEIWLSPNALLWGHVKLMTGSNPQDIWTVSSQSRLCAVC